MTQYLPPNLLALFAPREPIKYEPPFDKLPHEKTRPPYLGVAEFVKHFEDPKDQPPLPVYERREERRERKRKERAELQAYKIEQGIALWNPAENTTATGDPYKTLFVGRVNYETSESKLRREFERYGPVKRIMCVYDKNTSKPRGYAFVEFKEEKDMHRAYKSADGMKIDGRRVVVDVERGRTVKGWLPRRFGGGLGNSRRAKGPGGMDMEEWERIKAQEEAGADWNPRDRDRGDRHRTDRDRGERDRDRDRDTDRERRDRDRDRDRDRGGDRDRDRKRRSERPDADKDRSDRKRSRDEDRGGDRHRRDRTDRERTQREIKEEIKEDPEPDPVPPPSANGNGNINETD